MKKTRGTVLITGGARRVGAGIARYFTEKGYHVALHYHQSADEAEALAEEIGASLYQGDLTEKESAKRLISEVVEDHSDLTCLINNASTFRRAHLAESTEETLMADVSINLLAPLNLMREFCAAVQHGAVVNLLDTAIHHYHPAHFGYLVAKKALAEATQMAAREFAPAIRINGICPGHLLPTENSFGNHASDFEPSEAVIQPTIEQVADAAFMLVETESYYGQLLTIDGGKRLMG